jgi:hypothetical protein
LEALHLSTHLLQEGRRGVGRRVKWKRKWKIGTKKRSKKEKIRG